MLDSQQEQTDPETERKQIRVTLRLMRENFERGMYEGEEYQYWQKVNELKDKLALLERVPDTAINRAARTLLDLRESWENSTKEERKDLVHLMIQEVGVDLTMKHAVWVKVKPDYEPLFSIVIGLDKDADRRFWFGEWMAQKNNCDIQTDSGQTRTGGKIQIPMSHNFLTSTEEIVR